MTRYKVVLEYDGTDLIGWQENRQGPSVQSLVKDAIYGFCGMRPDVVGAGRTDAGVHAIAMTAHFDLPGDTPAETVMPMVELSLYHLIGTGIIGADKIQPRCRRGWTGRAELLPERETGCCACV